MSTTEEGGIYARISNRDEKAPKVKIQIAICKRLAEDDGVHVKPENIFFDDGIAASGKSIDDTTIQNRPGAQALLKAMAEKRFTRLYAVEGERLARTIKDGVEFVTLSAENGIIWHLDTDGLIDPATPAGEATAMDIFMSGRREGRVRDERQRRRYEREIKSGKPLWTTRAFGYKKDNITLKPKEADLIRTATKQYLKGDLSLVEIAKDWTDKGIKTDGMQRKRRDREGNKRMPRQYWTATTVRQVLLRPRNAGLLVHRGEVQKKSRIQAIITLEQHHQLKDRIKIGTKVGARSQSLMGGILKCACGAPMHNTISYSQRKGGPRRVYRIYKCSQISYDKSQKHASIQEPMVDDLFTSFILLDLYKGLFRAPGTSTLADDIKALADALESVREDISYQEERLTNAALKKMHAKIEAEWHRLQAEEEELLAKRDALLASAGELGALETFMTAWRNGPEGFESKENFDAWQQDFWHVWNSVSIQNKQALIRMRYRPTVAVGGRGVGRIQPNANLELGTFGKPVKESI